jgi:hypothetical protein
MVHTLSASGAGEALVVLTTTKAPPGPPEPGARNIPKISLSIL